MFSLLKKTSLMFFFLIKQIKNFFQPGSIINSKQLSTPGGSKRKGSTNVTGSTSSSEEIIKKTWDCVRTSNGIMVSIFSKSF